MYIAFYHGVLSTITCNNLAFDPSVELSVSLLNVINVFLYLLYLFGNTV